MLKAVSWVGSARRDVRAFAKDARKRAGYESSRASIPRTGSRCRPWDPGFGKIRIHTDGEHRVVYVTRFDEAIYVLHVFEKKTRKTRRADMDVGRKRLRDVLRDRERKKASPARG